MLMGEYNYYQNFLHSGAVTKILFLVFLIDMSVVLMNLVLGLAVSDIEQLQKNSGKFRLLPSLSLGRILRHFLIQRCAG